MHFYFNGNVKKTKYGVYSLLLYMISIFVCLGTRKKVFKKRKKLPKEQYCTYSIHEVGMHIEQ